MSSREFLVLLEGLPDDSDFKIASLRTFRVVEYTGNDPERKGSLYVLPAVGWPPSDVDVISEYVDWTYDRKLAARTVRELVALNERDNADFTNLIEPLEVIVTDHENNKKSSVLSRARDHVFAGLHGLKKGG